MGVPRMVGTVGKSKVVKSEAEALDKLVTNVTAFSSFEDMVKACEGGYIPTLLPVGPLATRNNRLAAALEGRGYKAWRGMKST